MNTKRMMLACSIAVLAAAVPVLASTYKLQETWHLGGDGSWDYLTMDVPHHLLYIARLTRVMVVDTSTGKLVKEIGGLQHAHGIALSPDGKSGYISDGGAGKIVVFDRSNYQPIASISAGSNPDSVVLEPSRNLLFAFNGASNNATVVDTRSNSVVATLPMPGKPEFSVGDGVGNIYVNVENTSQILRIDTRSLKITAAWALSPCEAPSGLAINREDHRLFAVCDNAKMVVVDYTSGRLVGTVPIGEDSDAVAYDSSRSLVFCSNGETGTLSVVQQVSPDHYRAVQTVPTQIGARTLALDPSTGAVYTVSAKLGPKPRATKDNPKARPSVIPDSFVVLALRE